jgi:hypothetical protein
MAGSVRLKVSSVEDADNSVLDGVDTELGAETGSLATKRTSAEPEEPSGVTF